MWRASSYKSETEKRKFSRPKCKSKLIFDKYYKQELCFLRMDEDAII